MRALCDIIAHTVILYVLFCLTYMHCTLYILHILYTVHIVHIPCFPVSDVEVSSSTSVRALVHTYKCSLSYSVALHLTKHHSYSLSYQCFFPHHSDYATISILGVDHLIFLQYFNI